MNNILTIKYNNCTNFNIPYFFAFIADIIIIGCKTINDVKITINGNSFNNIINNVNKKQISTFI